MTTQNFFFKIQEEDLKKRLDKFLSEKLKEYSRASIQKLIESGVVFVNNKKEIKRYALKIGDDIRVDVEELETINIEPDSTIKFEVLFENKDFAVINKPAGLVVHPSQSHKSGTLVNGLLYLWPEIKNVGDDILRPGLVHRLDKDTSGIMVIAKTNEIFSWLKEQFKERKIIKRYTALVYGKVKEKKGEILAKIARSGIKQVTLGKGRRHGNVRKIRDAKTDFSVREYIGDFTLVDAFPRTGRMHQVRVHLAHIGNSVVGDKKYTPKKTFQRLPFYRQFLHASKLDFFLPSGEKVSFSADLPEDLSSLLRDLKNK